MVSERVFRPRTLSAIFGVYFLVMAIIAWYSGETLGYHYTVDITRFTFTIYLVAGAVFLIGVLLAAVLGARSLDARIEKLERTAEPDGEVVEEVVLEEEATDAVPPPLEETAGPSGDHVDRDIDELLVSLQEMEQDAGTSDADEEVVTPSREELPASRATRSSPVAPSSDSRRLAMLRKKRNGLIGYVVGPALASIGAIGISAAMLPGSDAFLQTYYQLNTSLLLGLGYSFVGVAAYVAASLLTLLRSK